MNPWQPIAKIAPDLLAKSRLQIHYAVQFIAAVGAALAEPLPDDSHTCMAWKPELDGFVGAPLQAMPGLQVALKPANLTLMLLGAQGETVASLPLPGRTMDEGLEWLRQEMANRGVDASKIAFLSYPPDDFPDHPLSHGACFDASSAEGLRELSHYYANTDHLLQSIVTRHDDASAIHIWPHHFDMATLIMLPGLRDGQPLTVGVGLSPGDTSYGEPYWYVSPYPYPNVAELPDLAGDGFWHTRHWVGAVLPASHLADGSNSEQQRQQVEAFLDGAVKTAILLLKSP